MRGIGRWSFLAWGVGLALLKFAIDWAVARQWGEEFSVARYWMPFSHGLLRMLDPQKKYALALAATAIPFVAAGVWLCLRRLQRLGWHRGWAFLFFVPVVNLFFFATLVIADDRGEERAAAMPGLGFGKATAAVIVGIGGFAAGAFCATGVLKYGWGLFFAVPVAMGVASEILVNAGDRSQRALRPAIVTVLGALGVCGCLFLALAIEGVVCLAMAAPLAVVLGILGAYFSHALRWPGAKRGADFAVLAVMALSAPLVASVERSWPPAAEIYRVDSFIDIDRAPEAVWPMVIGFPEIEAPAELMFRAGIAYPIRARIEGSGVGAIRYCEFSTGPFVEPITVWEPGKRLAFSVSQNPEPMRELSIFEIHPPHLKGFLVSRQGEFRLEALSGGKRTRLHGSTWYQHGLEPAGYWRWWSDAIIHRIHLRVLEHIKKRAELTN